MAVGLATKTAIAKAIFKEVAVDVICAVTSTAVNIGSEEISKFVIE